MVGIILCRVLELCSDEIGRVKVKKGWIDIFIYLGYNFKVFDGFVINFYFLDIILMMFVCVFGGYERIMNVYKIVVDM